ncbi:MAG: hypothetical protein AUK47_00310 [Deltaproteobacteria bacterium CG2_30_63_29]|nr:MAG: hypothetical protein AUK47_00310 [Deltaproteobacteria bacterium CG2_30_63_29]PIW02428.1 MAG: hypothetical protein COW42_01770 [Deltaproteobacteria bacterium CG17_big_fil_post_rev_8_21_14_2_50_63_7]PJB42860.1 MAG: hypothetical protein CO108_11060 [Deltaproteobacteria bacterium CG_4_9_14_3_um_filter_63_12]
MNETVPEEGVESPELKRQLASHILQRLGEGGQPPEYGVKRINVGNESYLRVLEHEYFRNQLRIGASFKLVQGYFGGGKTHFLFCVREMAWEHGFVTAVVELSPSECPYDDAFKVYRAVARRVAIRPSGAFSAPSYGIADLIRNIVDDRLAHAEEAFRGKDVTDATTEAIKAVSSWLTKTVSRAPCESHSFRQGMTGLAMAYLHADRQTEVALEAWLLGEPVPQAEVRASGVFEQLGKANGFTMLRCLTQMVIAFGLPGTALLFDEVDRNLSVSTKRSHIIGDNLRQVIDLCGRHQLPNTLFLYAVPPEFMRNVVPDYPALYQRLKSPVPLSVRSPQSVLIDLEHLDLGPEAMLEQLGMKILEVFEEARACTFDRALQASNAKVFAIASAQTYFEVNHRRLFVKAWVDALFAQLVDGERPIDPKEATALITTGHGALTREKEAGDDFEDF